MTNKRLYLPSTPLNLLLSVAMALQAPKSVQAKLIYIDQREVKHNRFLETLRDWSGSPFVQADVLSGAAKGLAKLTERRANFAWLTKYLWDWMPAEVVVGSDRRIEFQYVMSLLEQHQPAQGIYLDDGLYSYAGKPTTWFKSKLSQWLHRVIYGDWWQEPETVGASPWIKQAWLFQPAQAISPLQQKDLQRIEPEWLMTPVMRDFAQALWRAFSRQTELPDCDVLLLLPHPNNVLKMPDYEPAVRRRLTQWLDQGKRVAVKYHPRVGDEDPWQLSVKTGVTLLPSALPTEVVYLLLPSGVTVAADVGTAVLTANWLRPDLSLQVELNSEDGFQARFLPIMRRLGIPIMENKEKNHVA